MVTCRLKALRQARGLAQPDLAAAAGVTRQAIGAIEAGTYVPNTAVALLLARRLGCRVEDLFALDDAAAHREVAWAAEPPAPGGRAQVARVRERWVGHALRGAQALHDGFAIADAVADDGGVRLLTDAHLLERTALLLGCDPAFDALAAQVARRGDLALHVRFAASQAALDAVAAGHAHLAGSHLYDPRQTDGNLDRARAALAATGGVVIAFAAWEQGLMVAGGNPHALHGVADLARPGLRFLNREPGSGSRALLDACLAAAGVPAAAVPGYAHCAPSHLAAARAIAAGAADAAIGLRAVADALGLDFVPLQPVRCDLIVPADLAGHPAVAAALDALTSRALRDDLAALPGYDTAATGSVVLDVPPQAA